MSDINFSGCGAHMYVDSNNSMRDRSGNIKINSKLVSFLYELMRDHMLIGDIEAIVRESEKDPNVTYTNGWLAKYAEDVANRLT